ARRAPLVTAAIRLAHHRDALAPRLLEGANLTIVAAPDLKADQLSQRSANPGDCRGKILEFDELAVDKTQPQVLVEQGDAFGHAVEHGLDQAKVRRGRTRARSRFSGFACAFGT